MKRILTPTKKTLFRKEIYGFDIETYGDNNKFLMASISSRANNKLFFSKKEFIREIVKKKYRNSVFAATNLSFDFFGIFFDNDVIRSFRFINRGSDLLSAKTYIYKGKFHAKRPNKSAWKIEFIDTLNYARLSVEKIGKILKLPKLKKPKFLGKKPSNKKQWDILIDYNIRDSEISRKFIEFLIDAFDKLGANFKTTIAQVSLSLFRNKYLKDKFINHDPEVLDELFNAYYGGRVETFKRGYFKSEGYQSYKLYDINSLYPSVMKKYLYPDPKSIHFSRINHIRYIMKCEGVSKVDIYCPDMKIPLLPLRRENKLIFSKGNFTGWYSHVELRKAIELGYIIKKVYRSIYYTNTISIFKDFVDDLYALRKQYKKQSSPMEFVTKILMNSLYGKFAQKYKGRLELQPFNHTIKELMEMDMIERKGSYIYYKKDSLPSIFCFPEWSLYVTAYARLELYKYLQLYDPIYCDTDSIITRSFIPSSTELGEMKLEYEIEEMIIVKPKFYALKTNKKDLIKIKGIATSVMFSDILNLKTFYKYQKFCKIREALRRGLIPNQKIIVSKNVSLIDNKRIWKYDFSIDKYEESEPICV